VIRVVIADDHAVMREGLRRIISEFPDIKVVAEASDGMQAVAACRNETPDILLLDLSMPGPGFLEVLEQVTAGRPGLRVLVLSAHPEEQYARRVLRAGASGYITKNQAPEELVTAIRRVARGGKYVSEAFAGQLAADLAAPVAGPDRLSNREYEVLAWLGAGKSVKEIAAAMKLSPKTVSTYRTRLLEKLGLRTTAELIRFAVERQITI
jgi:DNA-binding NarL/FixJ family response regulator